MLAQVRSCAVTQRSWAPCSVSTVCQQQDKIMLRSVIFCSTFLTFDDVLVNIIDYTIFNSYRCFCGNIFKQKFLVMKKCEHICKWEMWMQRGSKSIFIIFIFTSQYRRVFHKAHSKSTTKNISTFLVGRSDVQVLFSFSHLSCLSRSWSLRCQEEWWRTGLSVCVSPVAHNHRPWREKFLGNICPLLCACTGSAEEATAVTETSAPTYKED